MPEPSYGNERRHAEAIALPVKGPDPAQEIAVKLTDSSQARLSDHRKVVSLPQSKFVSPPAMVEIERRPREIPHLSQMVEASAQAPPREEAAFPNTRPPARTSTVEIVRERAEVRYVSPLPSPPQTLPASESGEAGVADNTALRKPPAFDVLPAAAPAIRPREQPRRLNAVKSDKMPAESTVRPPAEMLNSAPPREDSPRVAPLLRPALQPHLPDLRPENKSDPRVTVHIGTLEIRALDPKLNLQAQASTPAAPLPSPAGFDAFSHLRSYEPWPR
jgi:hypothetical protein